MDAATNQDFLHNFMVFNLVHSNLGQWLHEPQLLTSKIQYTYIAQRHTQTQQYTNIGSLM